MDISSSLFSLPSHSGAPTTAPEEGTKLEVYHIYEEGCWGDAFSDDGETEFEYPMDAESLDANSIDFHSMKARRASRHAVEHSHTTLARRRRTTKRELSGANRQEPIGSRNDIWREGLEKGALTTYNQRRCRCDYCMHLDTLAEDRRTLRWALRRAERGRRWEGGRPTANKEPRWVDYDWDVGYEDGDSGEWSGAESVFEPERVPPIEVGLLDLVRDRRPQYRRAAHARLSLYPGIANRGTNGLLLAAESDLSIESTSPTSDSGPLPCDHDWEVLSLCSEWDRCSVQSL